MGTPILPSTAISVKAYSAQPTERFSDKSIASIIPKIEISATVLVKAVADIPTKRSGSAKYKGLYGDSMLLFKKHSYCASRKRSSFAFRKYRSISMVISTKLST